MRALLALLAATLLLAACVSRGSVTLLPGEAGAPAGSVVVLDPKTGAEKGSLTAENTRTRLGRAVAARTIKATRYAKLTSGLPAPAAHYTLYFLEGTTTLTPESQPVLKDVFAEIAKRPGAEVQITGHTDTVGKEEDNDMLSLRRAFEIREVLVAQGLNPNITRSVGRGSRELLVPTPPNTEEPRNRRVEITVR
ncbi:MAG: OmpA family protein [Proteobacteria bacterium]|nr:OmpA family protein [Pseudomonadota bacterium]